MRAFGPQAGVGAHGGCPRTENNAGLPPCVPKIVLKISQFQKNCRFEHLSPSISLPIEASGCRLMVRRSITRSFHTRGRRRRARAFGDQRGANGGR
jgi:hypothetical protein